jgi:dGTPase
VEAFEQRYARFPGLNLTFEVREGMAKHSRDIAPGEIPGLDEYLPGLRPPMEAQIIDLADEIAYSTADLDDSISAEFFSFDDIVREIPQFAEIAEAVDTQFAGASERLRFSECLRALIDWLVSGLIQGTVIAAQQARVESVEDVRRFPSRIVQLTPETRDTAVGLKGFLKKRVYFSDSLAEERDRSCMMLAELFEFFMANPARLPDSYETSEEALHRRVCDYIAGMTDGYLRRMHEAMINSPHPLSRA